MKHPHVQIPHIHHGLLGVFCTSSGIPWRASNKLRDSKPGSGRLGAVTWSKSGIVKFQLQSPALWVFWTKKRPTTGVSWVAFRGFFEKWWPITMSTRWHCECPDHKSLTKIHIVVKGHGGCPATSKMLLKRSPTLLFKEGIYILNSRICDPKVFGITTLAPKFSH